MYEAVSCLTAEIFTPYLHEFSPLLSGHLYLAVVVTFHWVPSACLYRLPLVSNSSLKRTTQISLRIILVILIQIYLPLLMLIVLLSKFLYINWSIIAHNYGTWWPFLSILYNTQFCSIKRSTCTKRLPSHFSWVTA